MFDLIIYIANEFEMHELSKEGKKLDKIDNDEFVKLVKKKLSFEEYQLFDKHELDVSKYWFVRQRKLIEFTINFIKSINN